MTYVFITEKLPIPMQKFKRTKPAETRKVSKTILER